MSPNDLPVAAPRRRRSARVRSWSRAGLIAVVCAGLVIPNVALNPVTPPASAAPSTPNIVVILTDDQPKGMIETMPVLRDYVVPTSTTFANAVTPTSVCCPSRTSLLTGKYSNESGVYGINRKKFGGYKVFQAKGNQHESVPVKLNNAGYATGLFGKYLNGYRIDSGEPRPPGWNRWTATVENDGGNKYTDYRYTADAPDLALAESAGAPTYEQRSQGEYVTSHMGKAAVDFIEEVPSEVPLFAVYTPYAPHAPFTPEPKFAGAGVKPPGKERPDSEKNVSEEPHWVQVQPKKAKVEGMEPRAVWRKQTAVLRSVDEQVGLIIEALERTGRWENTLLVFTSDNGYAFGQNRVTSKNNPYRPSSEVDLIVRYPGQQEAAQNGDLVTANVDVAATLLTAAGLPNSTSGLPLGTSGGRLGIPMMGTWNKMRGRKRPPYCGWRTTDELFVRYGSKEEEYYNYRIDPGGKENLIPIEPVAKKGKKGKKKPARIKKLNRKQRLYAARAAELRALAAAACTNPSPDFGPSFDKPTWKYKY